MFAEPCAPDDRSVAAAATVDETDTDDIANRASAVVDDAFESNRLDCFDFHRRVDDASLRHRATATAVVAGNSSVHRNERVANCSEDTSAASEAPVHDAVAAAAVADSVASNRIEGLACFLRKFIKLRTRMGNDDANQLGIKQLAKSTD